MWLLNYIPNFFIHVIVAIGVIGIGSSIVLGFIPFISTYKTPLQVLSIVILTFGVYLEGALSNKKYWDLKIAEAENRVLIAEKKAAEANAKIEYVYVDRIKYIERVKYEVLSSIRENANELDANCKVSPKAVQILNNSAVLSGEKK